MSAPSATRTRGRFPVADAVISVVLAAVFTAALLTAMEWGERAGLFPRIVTTAGLVLSVLHLLLVLARWALRAPAAAAPPAVRTGDEEEDVDDVEYIFATAGTGAWLRSLAWVAAFFVGLYVVGLLVTAPVFALLYLRFSARTSWLVSGVYAVVTAALLYGVFELALELPTPPGLLFP
ncbi:tripartite tricarboxylate transporter TctB family protein [Blastococcus sp. SYSU D00820]